MDGLGVFCVGQASVCLGPHLDEGWGCRAVKPVWASGISLLAVPGWCFFCGSFVSCVCQLSRLFIPAIWSPEGKELTSWLLFVMFIVILLLALAGCKRSVLRVHEG